MTNRSARSRWKGKRCLSTAAVLALTLTVLIVMLVVSSTNHFVAGTPMRENENGTDDNGSSFVSLGGMKMAVSKNGAAGSIRATGVSSSLSSFSFSSTPTTMANDCVDNLDFFYEGKQACAWIKKRRRAKRCKILYESSPLAERCRETCDYNDCKTILEQKNRLLIGAYYYPWWGNDFHRGNPDNPHSYVRRLLTSPQQFPALLEYDDTLPEVIEQHLKWSRQGNIQLWVTSWWGEGRREDLTIKNHILTHPKLKDHKIAVFYETTGRIREKLDYSLENVRPDLEYLCKEYFHHSNYYQKVDENDGTKRPVLFVYLTRKLEQLGLLEQVVSLMREGAKDGGCDDIFIVGDQVFQGPPSQNNEAKLIPFEILDAVTTYDSYGSMRGRDADGYIGSKERVHEYYQSEQQEWKTIAQSKGCAFIPSATPGFNDRGVRPEAGHVPLSRRLSPEDEEGSLFQTALRECRPLVDWAADNLIMINSFNEWHEDTQIEPVVAFNGAKDQNSWTKLPENLTHGIEYEAYGDKYLRILNEETKTWNVVLANSASVSSVVTISTVAARVHSNDVDSSSSSSSSSNDIYSEEEDDLQSVTTDAARVHSNDVDTSSSRSSSSNDGYSEEEEDDDDLQTISDLIGLELE